MVQEEARPDPERPAALAIWARPCPARHRDDARLGAGSQTAGTCAGAPSPRPTARTAVKSAAPAATTAAAKPAPKPAAKPARSSASRVRDGKFEFTVRSVKCGIAVWGKPVPPGKGAGPVLRGAAHRREHRRRAAVDVRRQPVRLRRQGPEVLRQLHGFDGRRVVAGAVGGDQPRQRGQRATSTSTSRRAPSSPASSCTTRRSPAASQSASEEAHGYAACAPMVRHAAYRGDAARTTTGDSHVDDCGQT